MQNTTLPIQLSPAIAAPSPNRMASQANSDTALFSQTLNREMAQRQEAQPAQPDTVTPQPQPVHQQAAAQPQPVKSGSSQAPAPAKEASHSDDGDADSETAATTQTAAAAPAAPATTTKTAGDEDTDSAAAAAQGAAAAAPVADMLALLANYKQLMAGGAGKTAATTADASAALKTVRTSAGADAQTLATLQTALKSGVDTTAEAPTGAVRASMHMPADTAAAAGTKADPALGAKADPAAAAVLTAPAGAATPQTEAALSSLRDAAITAAAKDTAPVTASAFQAQMATVSAAQTGVTAASDHIPAPLGSTAWDNQVSQKVVWMVGGADQTASLTLNPPDLGPVQVVLNVNNDQATVAFSSATPEVRAALENAMPRLREMLSDAGVTLGQASVNANMPDQRQANTSQGQGGDNTQGRSYGNGHGVRSGETEIAVPATSRRVVRDNSNVDTFA